MMEKEDNKLIKFVGCGIIAIFMIVLFINACSIVDPAERGVLISMGKASDAVLVSGVHFKVPFVQKVKKYSLTPQGYRMVFGVSNDGAVSRDMQTIGTTCVVYWRYNEEKILDIVNNYTDSSLRGSIENATLAAVKETIGTYTIYELVERQEEVAGKIASGLKFKTNQYPVEITQVTVSNWDWPDSFDQQIAETMAKMQQVRQAEQDLLITEQNSQKQIKEADAKKQATIIDADAALERAKKDAEATRIAADALAYKNQRIAENLPVELKLKALENERLRIEKWDGHYVPTNNYGPIPFQQGKVQGE